MHRHHKHGVIAVLFLIVAAFIFGAISLSMQTGQIIERRVKADQATDAASFSYASKSAQGLNFMAANNLAIAGASHMAGALHIAADWAVIISAIFVSKPVADGGKLRPTNDELDEDHQIYYDIFSPATALYFRIGIGLTTLNKVIKATYPYLGMVDAISTGGANAPSAIFIPFQRGSSSPAEASQENSGDASFMSKIKDKVLTLIQVLPAYQGLKYINSDETFCLAFHAGSRMKDDQHPIAPWFNGPAFGVLSPLVSAINGLGQVLDLVGMFGGYIGLQVGYSGCGFAKTGKPVPGKEGNTSKNFITNLLTQVLTGPLSGRPMNLTMGDKTYTLPVLTDVNNTPWTADRLATLLNERFKKDCGKESLNLHAWDIDDRKSNRPNFRTPVEHRTGACVVPVVGDFRRHARQGTSGFTRGTKEQGNDDDQNMFVQEYDVACHGTILFKWEAYSGLQQKIEQSDPATGAPETHPLISNTDVESDLCLPFDLNRPNTPWSGNFPAPPKIQVSNNLTQFAPSWVNLSRKKPLVEPILNGLKVEKPKDPPPGWKGNDPRPYAVGAITKMLFCAMNVPDACDKDQDNHGYFESTENEDGSGEVYRFYPQLDTWNWLCAATPEGDIRAAGIREMLQFANPNDASRWLPTSIPDPTSPDVQTPSRYIWVQDWHNSRVKDFTDKMGCGAYDRYAKGTPKHPKPPKFESDNASHDYCQGSQHFCWQRGMQKAVGDKLKDGNLSFIVPELMTEKVVETTLEKSLHYAVLSLVPLRTDNKTDIVGAPGAGTLPHCPEHLTVDAKLEDGTVVPVCDIQPLVGYISRTFTKDGSTQDRFANEKFGGGNVNLASGGALEATNAGTLGTAGFMSIAQSAVRYERIDASSPFQGAKDPYQPNLAENADPKPSFSKNYQMFWPSWKPTIEPSRVMSHLLPPEVAYAVED